MFGTICPSIFHMQIQDRFNSNSAMVHKGVPGAIAPVTTRMRYSLGVAQALGTKPKHTYNLFIFMEGSLLTFVKNTVPVLGRAPKMYISLHRSIHLRECSLNNCRSSRHTVLDMKFGIVHWYFKGQLGVPLTMLPWYGHRRKRWKWEITGQDELVGWVTVAGVTAIPSWKLRGAVNQNLELQTTISHLKICNYPIETTIKS